MPSPSRRLTTLWFADIAGFTRLSAQDEPLALHAMEAMRSCVKRSVSAHNGTVIKFLGDGALAEFPSTEGGVEAALELAASFKGATTVMPGGPFHLHIGIHVGDVTVSADGDIFGDGVNRAARLEHLGEPGQVLVSEEVFRLVRKRPELHFTSLGERTAKGLDEPFQIFEVEPKGAMVERLKLLEKPPAAPLATPHPTRSRARHPRAIGTGIVAGVTAFIGLGIWTAFGGTADEPAATVAAQTPSTSLGSAAIPARLPLPVRDPAFVLAPWPPKGRDATVTSAATAVAPSAAAPTTFAGLTSQGERYLADLRGRDLGSHELLPFLRIALDEAKVGNPTPARVDAIRALVLFVAARDARGAETAFQKSLAADANSGMTRLLYAKLLTAVGGRSGEALYQLDQAKGKGVSNATLEAARGAVLFRDGKAHEAQQALERSLKSENVLATRILLARTLVAQDKSRAALKVLEPELSSLEVVHWMAYARLRDAANKDNAVQTRMLDIASRRDAGYAGAVILHDMGQDRSAADALDRLARLNDPDLIWLGVDPEWASIRDEARFRRLASRALGSP